MANQPVTSSLPFSPSGKLLNLIDINNCSYIEVLSDNQRYMTMVEYIVAHSEQISSFSTRVSKKNKPYDPFGRLQEEESKDPHVSLGLGLFSLDFLQEKLYLLHQTIGKPVGTNMGPVQLRSVVIFVAGLYKKELLISFLEEVAAWSAQGSKQTFLIYTYSHQYRYWQQSAEKFIRPIDSVILPKRIHKEVIEDITDFVSEDTAKWYFEHGIPYKRSFLFYGPPGSGKSSLIQVIAGDLKRNLCFLQPSDPQMTDESLSKCLLSAPKNSVIVIEDIDALFGKDRQTTQKTTPLTFSGLLNALDGIANPDGQIFILTTNYINRLDDALIRAGRVDVKVKFGSATQLQAKELFLHFYPNADKEAVLFAEKIGKYFEWDKEDGSSSPEHKLVNGNNKPLLEEVVNTVVVEKEGDKKEKEKEDEKKSEGDQVKATAPLNISMALLQQHFIKCRKNNASACVALTDDFCKNLIASTAVEQKD